MEDKVVTVLIGVIVGWLMSQLSELIKERFRRRKKVEAVYTEAADVEAWLSRMLKQAEYSLQLAILKERITSIPSDLHVFMFEAHFHEICMYLPRGVRVGFTDYYGSVTHINHLLDQLKDLIDSDVEQHEKLAEKFEAIFAMAFTTKSKINVLLSMTDGDMGKLKGLAKKTDQDLKKSLLKIEQDAYALGVKKIRERYYSE